MVKIIRSFKNGLLNKSDQYRYYKSEYMRLKEKLSSAQKKIKYLETNILKGENNNRKLPKKIEELKLENQHIKEDIKGNSHYKKRKKLADIRTSHNRESLENVSIGEYTYGNPKIRRNVKKGKLTIGKFCSIGEEVTILIGMGHHLSYATTFPFTTFLKIKPQNVGKTQEKSIPEETVIGNDVWIGYGALILSGVTIGDGAVIGARTVVSKDVEPYSIVAGSPLKHLRYRFPKDIRDILVEKKWWDLPEEKIEELVPYLLDLNIHNLLEKL
ncbi:CatB-related O-acetyltransferase [Methanobacterium spitsbergense]|nr:CatB-related O-acetyltransferase [Methanobacterium spitsbergense]